MVMVIGPTKNKAEAKAEARRETQRAEAKAANEAAKNGEAPPRVDTSGAGNAPLTQSLADLLPEGYSIRSEPEAPVEAAPAPAAPEAPAPTAMQRMETSAKNGFMLPGARTRPAKPVNTTSDITRGFSNSK